MGSSPSMINNQVDFRGRIWPKQAADNKNPPTYPDAMSHLLTIWRPDFSALTLYHRDWDLHGKIPPRSTGFDWSEALFPTGLG
jgi:hypothetical protein